MTKIKNPESFIGQQFSFFEIKKLVRVPKPKRNSYNKHFICHCVCGKECSIPIDKILSGHSRSCGCKKGFLVTKKKTRHGFASSKTGVRSEFHTWQKIKRRCLEKSDKSYHSYGGRGITICDEWVNNFDAFILYVGEKPTPKHSIDRINNDGNYEPGNVRWATKKEQARNTQNNVWIEFNGEKITLVEWAEKLNLNYKALHSRIKNGWSIEKSLTTPTKTGYVTY